eukprot:1754993-Alexandrium_andersonii.AAC.1
MSRAPGRRLPAGMHQGVCQAKARRCTEAQIGQCATALVRVNTEGDSAHMFTCLVCLVAVPNCPFLAVASVLIAMSRQLFWGEL